MAIGGMLQRLVASMGLPGQAPSTSVSRSAAPADQLAQAIAQGPTRPVQTGAPAPVVGATFQRWPTSTTPWTPSQGMTPPAPGGARQALPKAEYTFRQSQPPDSIADPVRAWSDRVASAQTASRRRRSMAATGTKPPKLSGAQRMVQPTYAPARLVGG